MPTEATTDSQQQFDYQNWKSLKRELAALDILNSAHIISPVEFVKTKHHCYAIKEYANGGTVAQLLNYRGKVAVDGSGQQSQMFGKRLSELETKQVMRAVIGAITDVYEAGLAIWDLDTETLLLQIGPELAQPSV